MIFLPCSKWRERVVNRNIEPFECFANGLYRFLWGSRDPIKTKQTDTILECAL